MTAKILVSTEGMSYADWLEYRKQGIGGSDASVVCGINRYKSPVELWLDKTGQLPPQEAGEAAYWGTQLEPFVRAEFTKRTGIEVSHKSELLQSEEYPFMLANLDGTCEVPEVGTCIFEAKTASAYKAGEWEDTIPDEYMLQVQHYMAVTGYAGAYIAVLIGGNTFKWRFVERDEELISMLIELETAFWNHVQDGTPPPLDGSNACAKFLADRFHDSIPKSHITLPDTAALLLRRRVKFGRFIMDNTKLKGRMSGKMQELQQTTGNQNITVTSAPETSLAPVDSTYLALTNNALDIIRANLKSQPLTLDLFDLVKSPSGGATVFEVPGLAGNEAAMDLTGIVLDYTTPRAYWDTPDPVEGTPPVCMSQNSIISNDGKSCALCPYNDFGSKDGDSNAKACKESVLLFLLRPNSIIPLLVRIPVTSKPRFLKYSTRLLSTLTPLSSVVTKITLEKATSKQGKPYALFNFQTVSTLGPEEAAQAKAFGQQFMEIVNAAQMVPELAQAS
ncbi:MAG: hypothetical protein HFF38_05755 [Lawsonibacter sp.]|nr:hypothetical protein [Lawsonibacter sp.]